MWELAVYPSEWATEISRFDEVWVASRFTEDAVRHAVPLPVIRMPLGTEPQLSTFLSRRHFAIPEAPFVFLFIFDFLSYIERKNPFAVLEAFRRLTRSAGALNVHLVVKTNNSNARLSDCRRLTDALTPVLNRVTVIDRTMTDNEIKNLVRCCDCFLSLHRSEGYGFSLAEAMYFQKPVIATAYSGNLEFMTQDNSCLIPYQLVPVREGGYPYGEGQVWAEPNVDAAVECMAKLVADHACQRAIAERGARHLRTHLNYRAAGLRYTSRLREILGSCLDRSISASG
jgi:glycosyltransferase involved in cell wall biosynthesis